MDTFDMAVPTDRRAYHREKSAEIRENWHELGCKQISIYVPNDEKLLVSAYAGALVTKRMLGLMNDEASVTLMANRKPKYSVKPQDVEALKGRGEVVDERCKYMMDLLRLARDSNLFGRDASRGIKVQTANWAMEWIIVGYLRSYYDATLYLVTHGDLPFDDSIPIKHFEVNTSVL
jgi:hypothetical protein